MVLMGRAGHGSNTVLKRTLTRYAGSRRLACVRRHGIEVQRYERSQHVSAISASSYVLAHSGGSCNNDLATHLGPDKRGGGARLCDTRALGRAGGTMPAWSAISAANASVAAL